MVIFSVPVGKYQVCWMLLNGVDVNAVLAGKYHVCWLLLNGEDGNILSPSWQVSCMLVVV